MRKYNLAIVGTKSMIRWKSTRFFAYDSNLFRSKTVMCYSSISLVTPLATADSSTTDSIAES